MEIFVVINGEIGSVFRRRSRLTTTTRGKERVNVEEEIEEEKKFEGIREMDV